MNQGETFSLVEQRFIQELKKEYPNLNDQINLNICCDNKDEAFINECVSHIQPLEKYSELSYIDTVFVLIFIFYALRYNEQTEDWLNTNFLTLNLTNRKLGYNLFMDITIGNLLDDNGENISSIIRKHIMGIPNTKGGTKKSKKSKKSKSKKQKSKKITLLKLLCMTKTKSTKNQIHKS